MVTLSLIAVAVLAVAVWYLGRRLGAAERELRGLRLLRSEVDSLRHEGERALAVTRTHLAAVAVGEPPARDVILRGAAHRTVTAEEALALYDRIPGLFVLDVRSPEEHANGAIPHAHSIPLDELEDRLAELPERETVMLVHCAAGGRSAAACATLAEHGWTNLLNLAGGMHAWTGPRTAAASPSPPPAAPAGTRVSYRGGSVTGEQVIAAIRECHDPEIPLNIYDLGLIYGVDIDESGVAVTMTLTSEGCPSARTIPDDVRRRVSALGPPNVSVEVVWDPPWHPSRISPEGKQKLGLA
jgi:metal-sulfur cluster biosynthetic enzyme/rhodanese-related sulfurtransferase